MGSVDFAIARGVERRLHLYVQRPRAYSVPNPQRPGGLSGWRSVYLRYRETNRAWIVWIASSGILMRVYRLAVYRRAIVMKAVGQRPQGVGRTPTAIPDLFSGNTGGISANETVIFTGFHAGAGGDELDFTAAAWNGDSAVLTSQGPLAAAKGDLVSLDGLHIVTLGAAQLSALWVNSGSNISLKTTDNVLLYAPSDASIEQADQLAAQLHTAADAVVLPGGGLIGAGRDKHILVAYDASFTKNGVTFHNVKIADVDLVNPGASAQGSTANLNVYASDVVSVLGVSLTSLVPDNIHFI